MGQEIAKHVVSYEFAKELDWPYPTEFCWVKPSNADWYVHRCFGGNSLIKGSVPAPMLTEIFEKVLTDSFVRKAVLDNIYYAISFYTTDKSFCDAAACLLIAAKRKEGEGK